MTVRKSRKSSGFVIYAFTTGYNFQNSDVKRVPLVNRGYLKGVLFLWKMEKKRVRGFGHRGGASLFKTLLGPPPPPSRGRALSLYIS